MIHIMECDIANPRIRHRDWIENNTPCPSPCALFWNEDVTHILLILFIVPNQKSKIPLIKDWQF